MSNCKFCPECNNLLYPKEDKLQKILMYSCRNCDHQETADSNCVYRNEVHHTEKECTMYLEEMTEDPTLPRTSSVKCSVCGHGEAVFFQANSRGDDMSLFFVCCNPDCHHKWKE